VSTDLTPVRATFRVVAAGVLGPLVLALGVSVGRFGQDARDARARALVLALESALAIDASAAAAAGLDSAMVLARTLGRLVRLSESFAFYDAASGYARARGVLPRAPDTLPRAVVAALLSLDRTFAARVAGRAVAIAPVKDADQWETLGAVLLDDRAAEPPLFPAGASALALLALVLTGAALVPITRAPGRSRRWPVFLPSLAFAIALITSSASPDAAGPESHGEWTAIVMGGWAVIAGIALTCVRRADRPLELREAGSAWLFLAPSFAHLLIFSIGPILFSLWLSFHEWNLLQPERPFVGLDNYRELAGDGAFWHAVRNTALYVLFVPAGMAVALGLALLADQRLPGVRLLRTVFFLPYVTSFVAISLVWRWMFQPDIGLLNHLLGALGVPPQPWLSSPVTALPSLMLMSVWMYAGYMMLIFLAGLQSIPESLYESARIDGAGPWHRFSRITLPLLRPTMLFILVTMVIFMFQVFTAVYVMTEGGPLHSTDVVVYHIYRAAWEYLRVGYASAMAWILFAIVFIITLVQFRSLGSRPAQ